jgi:branched-chain amino acid transport system substrate-binding protein
MAKDTTLDTHHPCSPRRRWLLQALAWGSLVPAAAASTAPPLLVGLDAEFGLENSTSAQAIELGIKVAIAEVNAAGGALGRPLELVTRDNHSMPARAMAHLRAFAAMPDLVAVFGGKFSPVMLESVPLVHELKLPLLAVWSSADPIVDNGRVPNYVFRLALRDSLAMPKMLATARQRGFERVGLLLANTGWGRSNLAAAERHVAQQRGPAIAAVAWHNWGEKSLLQRYQSLREAGAQGVLVVANDDDAALLVRELAAMPADQRLPLLFHQGITGGRFAMLAGPALDAVDHSVLQTYSFFNAKPAQQARFLKVAQAVAGVRRIEDIEAPAGVAHAYDMLHLLALAIRRAGRADRAAIRDALESLPPHQGLIKHYRPAFTRERHEALGADELLIARYRNDGVLVPAAR